VGVRDFEIKFSGRFADAHSVPTSVLIQVLGSMQRSIHLIAMQHEKVPTRTRDRRSGDIERKYPVICSQPIPGSYVVPVTIGDPSIGLFAESDVDAVGGLFSECTQVFSSGDFRALAEKIPDELRRRRLVEAFMGMAPPRGSGISASIMRMGADFCVALSDFREKGSSILLGGEAQSDTMSSFIGRLSEINFDDRKIAVIDPVSQRELSCTYGEAVEDMLLHKPRELIQVFGEVILDSDGLPKKIVNVKSIDEVDLAPVFLRAFQLGGRTFTFMKAIELLPELDPDTFQLFCIEDQTLGINVFAYSREQLIRELEEQLAFLWDTYAKAEEVELTEAAKVIRKALLDTMREDFDAA